MYLCKVNCVNSLYVCMQGVLKYNSLRHFIFPWTLNKNLNFYTPKTLCSSNSKQAELTRKSLIELPEKLDIWLYKSYCCLLCFAKFCLYFIFILQKKYNDFTLNMAINIFRQFQLVRLFSLKAKANSFGIWKYKNFKKCSSS